MRYYLALAVAAALYLTGSLTVFEYALQDVRFRLVTRPAGDRLLLVEVDAKSLEELSVWPWPRNYHATVVDRLVAAGAQRIAFAVNFAAASTAQADARFAEALAAAGDVVLAAVAQAGTNGQPILTEPLPSFRQHATVGSINVSPERDGLVRRMSIRRPWHDGYMPALAATLAGRESAPFSSFYLDFGIQVADIPRLSYADVLKGRFDPAVVAGKLVLIGATATALGDNLPVPLWRSMPGALLHALAFNSLVQDRALQRAGPVPVLMLAGLCTLLLGCRFARWSWRRGLAALLLASIGIWLLAVLVQYVAPVLLDTTPCLLALWLSYAVALAGRIDRQAKHLVLQRRSLQKVVDCSFDGILSLKKDGILHSLNPAAELIFRCRPDAVVGRPISALLPDLDFKTLSRGVPQEMRGRRSDGAEFPVEVSISDLMGDDRCPWTVFVRDVTERKAQEAIAYQAMHDALTGLPNRTLLQERLEQALEEANSRGQPLALLLLDLDRFKEVNDTLGHQVGDMLLEEVGIRLRAALRETDTVARLGGDEFAALLPAKADLKMASEAAERMVEVLRTPFRLQGLALEVGTSVGIALFPDHGTTAAELLRRADVAMYTAKRRHLGYEVYDQENDPNSVRQLTLSSELRRAIENQEFVLHYQPKIDLASGRVSGVEALVRWQHPEQGLLLPSEFIPIAERTGLIRPLTLWVLGDAARRSAAWSESGIEIDVAVNLSARSLRDQDLPIAIEALTGSCGLKPERIVLEITESAVMSDPRRARAVLGRLAGLGVRISIDDFGTGYSSLSYLRKLPVSELKIDKSFVMGMLKDENDAVIVRSIVDLAHNLGLKVTAEGVESKAVLDRLRSLGCDVAQGFVVAGALTPDEFFAWLCRQRLFATQGCEQGAVAHQLVTPRAACTASTPEVMRLAAAGAGLNRRA
jgi:diguanylate cyclase (GGDEF)-like protein/PAS domain S-box-containing protein